MAPAEGNKFWLARSTHGRDKIFGDSNILWCAAVEYFEWVEDNPLLGSKLFKIKNDQDKDEIVEESYSKMRAMTIEGLCLFLDISRQTWYDYRKRDGFIDIIGKIENVIRDQKFSGAAADLLNANIIARDLGLKDASSSELSGPDGGPIGINAAVVGAEMTNEEASNVYKELMG